MLMLTLTEGFLPSPAMDSTQQIVVNAKCLLSAEGSGTPKADLHGYAMNPTLLSDTLNLKIYL